ncbi:MAG: MFS transporter [Phycisphaerae bacterium]|nr:MFS transporter [Phycisphaerae bacterium]
MTNQDNPTPNTDLEQPELVGQQGRWWSEMTGYHWWVLLLATLGWMFDCMDQRLFVIARQPALVELLGYGKLGAIQLTAEQSAEVTKFSGYTTTALILGWATGGIIFGMMGDRLGRVRTLAATVLCYSTFTGLSGLSLHWWDFTIYRFMTGLGVGGAFAAAATLVAEVMPSRARPYCLGLMQALSAVGNIGGSLISGYLTWRYMFAVGILPGILVVLFFTTLREPERWTQAKDKVQEELGHISQLFTDRQWRYHTIIGVGLAVTGVIGLWGVGFWTPELVRSVVKSADPGHAKWVVSRGLMLQDVGALFGMLAFSFVAARMGRRPAFAVSFILGFLAIAMAFGFMRSEMQVYWMLPCVGFATLSVFGGYSIYFPELYPTRLRSTGTGFCYNVARYLAAFSPMALGALAGLLTSSYGQNAFRLAAVLVALSYFGGLVFTYFAPETKDKPLPE